MTGAFVETMKMIKIEHSVFALPFALIAAFWAADGLPEPKLLGLIVVAMVSARSAAMAFNRYLDAEIDARNPRTRTRSIPAGRLSRGYALGFTVATALLFILVAALINRLVLAAAPFMLLVLLGYSYTKRFTRWSHLVLGLALGLAPLGAWLAVAGAFSWAPLLLGLAVVAWVAGFDIIYACQDVAFDRAARLYSIPARLGVRGALRVSRALHMIMIAILVAIGEFWFPGPIYWAGFAVVVLCLAWEHALVGDGNLEKVDAAFFTMNGIVSLLFGATTIAAILV